MKKNIQDLNAQLRIEAPTFLLRFLLICSVYFIVYGIGVLNESEHLLIFINIAYLIQVYIVLYSFISAFIFFAERHSNLENSKRITLSLFIIYSAIVYISFTIYVYIITHGNSTVFDLSDKMVLYGVLMLLLYILLAKRKFFLRHLNFYKKFQKAEDSDLEKEDANVQTGDDRVETRTTDIGDVDTDIGGRSAEV